MKISDYYFTEKPTFKNRLLYAQFLSPYDVYAESKFGYLAAADELLESYKPIEELEEYINEFEESQDVIDEYDKAFIQAYRDFIKQEKLKEVTLNE